MKSMLTPLPSAESGGHDVEVRGLQFVYVCAEDNCKHRESMVANSNLMMVESLVGGWRFEG